MRQAIVLTSLLLLGAQTLVGAAAPDHPLTLSEALELLRTRNPALLSARAHTEAVQANEITASLRPNPVFNSANEDFNVFNPGRLHITTDQEFTEGVLNTIERGHKRQRRVEAARWGTQVARDLYWDNERQLEFLLKSNFVSLLLAKSNLDLARENLHDYQETIRLNEIRLKAGDISPTELDRIRVEEARFQNDLLSAQLGLDQARVQLATLLGYQEVPPNFDIEGKLEPQELAVTLSQLDEMALAHRPDYLAARDGISQAQANLRLASANAVTDVGVGAEYKRNTDENTVGFTITFPIRIFDRNQGEKARTRYELEASRTAEVAAKNVVLSDVAQAYQAYQSALSRAQLYSGDYLQRARGVRDRTEFSYRHGGASLLDYLDAVRSYRDVELAWRIAYAQLMTSIHQISFVTGAELQP